MRRFVTVSVPLHFSYRTLRRAARRHAAICWHRFRYRWLSHFTSHRFRKRRNSWEMCRFATRRQTRRRSFNGPNWLEMSVVLTSAFDGFKFQRKLDGNFPFFNMGSFDSVFFNSNFDASYKKKTFLMDLGSFHKENGWKNCYFDTRCIRFSFFQFAFRYQCWNGPHFDHFCPFFTNFLSILVGKFVILILGAIDSDSFNSNFDTNFEN